jgi:serine/threonine protein kinase
VPGSSRGLAAVAADPASGAPARSARPLPGRPTYEIVCDLAEGGTLVEYIAALGTGYTEEHARGAFRDIARNVQFLHDTNVVHRDLKLENILLLRSGDGDFSREAWAVCDLGLAIDLDGRRGAEYGSFRRAAGAPAGAPEWYDAERWEGAYAFERAADTRNGPWVVGTWYTLPPEVVAPGRAGRCPTAKCLGCATASVAQHNALVKDRISQSRSGDQITGEPRLLSAWVHYMHTRMPTAHACWACVDTAHAY